MLREATLEDIDRLIPFLADFITDNGMGIPPDDESMRKALDGLITKDDGVVFITENERGFGCIGLLAYPCYYNTGYVIAQELFWKVKNETGRELLAAAENWAKDSYCLNMISLEAIEPERVGMIYKRNGYRLLEHTYIKEMI